MRLLFATMLAMFGLAIVVPTAVHAADWTTVWQELRLCGRYVSVVGLAL